MKPKHQVSGEDLQQQLLKESVVLGQVARAQIFYDVQIEAKIKKQVKTILHRQKGLIHAQSFTAILGPSGSGKTTLLNFLSGRLMTNNLIINGQIKINSVSINSLEPYSNQIGYVMQQDALLGTLTPRECFMFAANLTLGLTNQKKILRVQELIKDLGLSTCADTKIGNAFIKGISGGQRKRTSIGVQLITNPGIIFLDEPTTGLDSTTALQVIFLLKKLAQQGRTVISTIHQPSSQLFCQFDRLMLLCDGKCIYHGVADQARTHFSNMGHECPKLMNASQFYLDLMSIQVQSNQGESNAEYQTAKAKHNEKISKFQQQFTKSKYYTFQFKKELSPLPIVKRNEVSIFYQIYLVILRSLVCLIRNPMDAGFKLIQAVFTSIVVIIVFGKIQNSIIQNVKGIVFFLVSSNAFAGIQGTLATFSAERPVFLRERFSKIYSTWTYFVARTMTNFPFELVYPTVGLVIIYYSTEMGSGTIQEFWKFVLIVNATYFCSASFGLFYSAVIPKLQTAMAMVPLLIIPFMLLSGFFLNLDKYHDIRVIFYPIMYLSPFKYGYQAGIIVLNKVFDPISPDTFELNLIALVVLGFILRFIACLIMMKISNPKRPKMGKLPEQRSEILSQQNSRT